jgi:hypothetical protein
MEIRNSFLSDERLRELLEVQAFFGLPSPALVEKDLYVVKALAAIAGIETAPLRLVFGGGTALSRAHRLVRRMSEDIDLRIVDLCTGIGALGYRNLHHRPRRIHWWHQPLCPFGPARG